MTTADPRDLMAALGNTPVAEILGSYETLLDRRHDLEIEALRLRNEGESLGSARALAIQQALRDAHRGLGIYRMLAEESERLMGARA